MIYWVTNSGASSARIYQEGRPYGRRLLNPTPFHASGCARDRPHRLRGVPVAVRPPCTLPGTDLAAARKGAEARFNIVHFTQMEHGGHLRMIEQPQLWWTISGRSFALRRVSHVGAISLSRAVQSV